MKRPADVIPISRTSSWDAVRREYERMTQMGWQSVQQAAKVGAMLIELKKDCDRTGPNNFQSRLKVELPHLDHDTRAKLMKLAAHLPLLEKRQPESQAKALALIPKKKPKKQKAKQAQVEVEDEADEEIPITPAQYRNAFDMRASTIRGVVRAIDHYEQFGTPTQPMIAELRAIARLIETVAQKLEKRT